MEHLERFGLARDPFRNEPQLDFWFESAAAAAARQRLLRCLRQRKALSVLVGEVGAGTTTLARVLIEELEPERFEVGMLVVGHGVEPTWLRGAVARQLGVAEPAAERADALRQLYERLVEIRKAGRHAVVAIDEAQALAGSEALAELLSLLNFEHDESYLLSVVLVGSPELERALARSPSLLGRVELRVRLEPLAGKDARGYLAHRLDVAGGDPALFSNAVMDAIAERAGGLPRRMNALADNTLFEAYLAGREHPTPADVMRAAADLPWAQSSADTVSGLAPAAPDGAGDERLDADAPDGLGWDDAAGDPPTVGLEATDPDAGALAALDAPGATADLEADAPDPEEFDAEVLFDGAPDQTEPGAWRRARPAAEAPAAPHEPLPDEDEIDGLFVDLLEEER